jgi:sn-glycerol 3-phosphate transport system permease protein
VTVPVGVPLAAPGDPDGRRGWRDRLPWRRAPMQDAPLASGRGDGLLAVAFLGPSLLVFSVFVFYPLGRTIWLGQHDEDPFGRRRVYVGMSRFWDVLQSDSFRNSLGVTVRFTLITVPLGLALGLVLALLAHQQLRGVAIFRTIFSSTVATSVAVASLMWLTLFNPSIGVVNQLLEELGRDPVRWLQDKDTALAAVAMTTVWQNLGITFIIISAGLQSLPDDLYEAARVDGIGWWRQLRHITVPLLSPTLLFASVVLTISAFQSFGQIDLLTSGGPLDSTNVVVYSIFSDARAGDPGLAAAQATLLFVILLALTIVQLRVLERRTFYGGDR